MDSECESRKRNIDKRRETSRCAARDRRGKEADVFSDLKDVVPLVEDSTVGHLDRIALLRVAATVCRLRHQANDALECSLGSESAAGQDLWVEDTVTECLDGFVIISDVDGTLLYITESVAMYLGLTQTDMAGRSLKEFLHSEDFEEFRQMTGEMIASCSEEISSRNVVFRMKSVISPRGRNLNMKNALYKPVSFAIKCRRATLGHVVFMQGVSVPAGQGSVNANATALTKSSDTPAGTYMTRHSCDMIITYISERFNYLLKKDLKGLVGASFYDLVHPTDCQLISKAMKELFAKGHVRTPYYRLMTTNGNLVWVMTEASTTSHTTKGQKGLYVVCVHFVIGLQSESESLIMSTDAVPAGLPVQVKKEIDDMTEYIGRQPEVIDGDNYVPLFGSEDYTPSEQMTPELASAETANNKESFEEVLEWLFRDKPAASEAGKTDASQNRDPTLASAQLMAMANRSPCETAATAHGSPVVGGGEKPGSRLTGNGARIPCQSAGFEQQCYAPSGAESTMFTGSGNQPVAAGYTSSSPSGVSAVRPAVANPVPTTERSATGMFSAMLVTDSTVAPAQQSDEFCQMGSNYGPVIEDLQWEEPDLTGLAPFIPDEDDVNFGVCDELPNDLQLLFSDMPDWTPAQPLIRGPTSQVPPKAMANGMGFKQFDCYNPAATTSSATAAVYPNSYTVVPDPQPYWPQQQSTNWRPTAPSQTQYPY